MNDISTRFIIAYNYLLKEGFIKGQKDFSTKIFVSTSMITEIIKGRSNVGISAIQNTVSVFGVNANWLLTGEGEMLIKEEKKENLTLAPKEITSCTNCDVLRSYIKILEEKIAGYEGRATA